MKTGEQLAEESADEIGEGLAFFNYVLLGFAGITLFVGIFIILNTFSIIVAQRTREPALLRAMGASRKQMIASVVVEAVVIGLVASVVGLGAGLGAGIGVGALLATLFSTLGGGSLALAGIAVPASAIISSFAVGIVVTVLAALLPAVRASRIPPVAALREAAHPRPPADEAHPLGSRAVAGRRRGSRLGFTDGTLWPVMTGLLVAFVGVALLTPLISRPVVSVFGALLGVVVGTALGVAAVRALDDLGITDQGIPWAQLGAYLLISAGVGVVAAILPAIRAARLNVLQAISYD